MKIYLITNTKNNKKYIGQTKSTISKRFSQHCEPRNKTAMSLAIKKYGKQHFTINVIHEGVKSSRHLNELEVFYINKYNTISPNGYNIERGGSTPMSDSTRKKLSKKLKGRKITWKDKVSSGVKKLWEDDEYRKKQTAQRHGKRGNYRKGIIKLSTRKQVDLNEFKLDYEKFMTVKNLSEKYKISVNIIYRIIKREGIKKRGYKCNN